MISRFLLISLCTVGLQHQYVYSESPYAHEHDVDVSEDSPSKNIVAVDNSVSLDDAMIAELMRELGSVLDEQQPVISGNDELQQLIAAASDGIEHTAQLDEKKTFKQRLDSATTAFAMLFLESYLDVLMARHEDMTKELSVREFLQLLPALCMSFSSKVAGMMQHAGEKGWSLLKEGQYGDRYQQLSVRQRSWLCYVIVRTVVLTTIKMGIDTTIKSSKALCSLGFRSCAAIMCYTYKKSSMMIGRVRSVIR